MTVARYGGLTRTPDLGKMWQDFYHCATSEGPMIFSTFYIPMPTVAARFELLTLKRLGESYVTELLLIFNIKLFWPLPDMVAWHEPLTWGICGKFSTTVLPLKALYFFSTVYIPMPTVASRFEPLTLKRWGESYVTELLLIFNIKLFWPLPDMEAWHEPLTWGKCGKSSTTVLPLKASYFFYFLYTDANCGI